MLRHRGIMQKIYRNNWHVTLARAYACMHTRASSTSILMMDSECDEPMPGSSSEPVVDVDSGQDTSCTGPSTLL